MKNLRFLLLTFALALVSYGASQETVNDNTFTAALYKEISKNNHDNFVVSPVSTKALLTIMQSKNKNTEHVDNISKINKQLQLKNINKLYVKKGHSIKDELKISPIDHEAIDFSPKSEAIETINKYMEEQTENKVHDIIASDDLNDNTEAILFNSLFFKSRWAVTFDLFYTEKRKFYKTANDSFEVSTMQLVAPFNYYENSELSAKFLELPFHAENASMVVALPNDKEGLFALEKQIDKVLSPQKFTEEIVKVTLPRFKIKTKIHLQEHLHGLGVDEADFSALEVDDIIQKNFIGINEDGAAIVTNIMEDAEVDENVQPKQFLANHPFIFYIKVNNMIVLEGRLSIPCGCRS